MYTSKNIWLEKEKYLEKQKKPALVLKLILMEKANIKLTPV